MFAPKCNDTLAMMRFHNETLDEGIPPALALMGDAQWIIIVAPISLMDSNTPIAAHAAHDGSHPQKMIQYIEMLTAKVLDTQAS